MNNSKIEDLEIEIDLDDSDIVPTQRMPFLEQTSKIADMQGFSKEPITQRAIPIK